MPVTGKLTPVVVVSFDGRVADIDSLLLCFRVDIFRILGIVAAG